MVDYTFILFECPECGNVLKIPKTYNESQGCCPFCEKVISAPDNEEKVIKTIVDKNEHQNN